MDINNILKDLDKHKNDQTYFVKEKFSTLKFLRESCDISYQEMSEILGISKCYYWQIENQNRRLYYDLACKIADVFNLKPDIIFYKQAKEKKK